PGEVHGPNGAASSRQATASTVLLAANWKSAVPVAPVAGGSDDAVIETVAGPGSSATVDTVPVLVGNGGYTGEVWRCWSGEVPTRIVPLESSDRPVVCHR